MQRHSLQLLSEKGLLESGGSVDGGCKIIILMMVEMIKAIISTMFVK